MGAVDDSYWLKRIDAHLDRGNELFEEVKVVFAENREFMRELTLRAERTAREQLRGMREHTDEVLGVLRGMQRHNDAVVDELRGLRRHSDEVVNELRAQRGALLAILDRLPPPAPGATG